MAASFAGALGSGLLHGLKLVAVAVVAHALLGMARSLAPDRTRASIALAALAAVTMLAAASGQLLTILLGAGAGLLAVVPTRFGIPGYIAPIVIITSCYALFQTANNTSVMLNSLPEQRGAISGLLNLSRNLGLITGASVMGAIFAFASATSDITNARPDAIANGMRITFAVAASLIVIALAITASAKPSSESIRTP